MRINEIIINEIIIKNQLIFRKKAQKNITSNCPFSNPWCLPNTEV